MKREAVGGQKNFGWSLYVPGPRAEGKKRPPKGWNSAPNKIASNVDFPYRGSYKEYELLTYPIVSFLTDPTLLPKKPPGVNLSFGRPSDC